MTDIAGILLPAMPLRPEKVNDIVHNTGELISAVSSTCVGHPDELNLLAGGRMGSVPGELSGVVEGRLERIE